MLNIGGVEIVHPFVLAALSGFSDLPMRRVARRYGAAYAVNEVVLDRCVVHPSDWQRKLLSVATDDHPVGAQLMGADPHHFGPAAHLLSEAGYDVIDINFGCPVPKVLNRCRGGYLLSEPTKALEIVRRVVDAVGEVRPVTVKMRRGVDHSERAYRSFLEILDGAIELGISAVTVHGRTVEQRYRGQSDTEFIAKVKRHVGSTVVLASGDLFAATDCVARILDTGVDGVTIARGAIGNPWIFRDCLAQASGWINPTPPSLREQRDAIRFHFAEVANHYGPIPAAKIMRKLMIGYSKHHPKPRKIRDAFLRLTSPAEFADALDHWYGPPVCESRMAPAIPQEVPSNSSSEWAR